MTESVDVPAIGSVNKQYVYAGVALVAGIGGYAWWHQRGSSKNQPVVVNGNDVIPATDRVSPATGDSTVNVDGTAGKITTNAQWTQFVVDKVAAYGFDPVVASASLGKWLTHSVGNYTATDVEVIQRAVGLAGYPPESGPWIVPAVSAATTTTPPPAGGTSGDLPYHDSTVLNTDIFNTNGWSDVDKNGAPWLIETARSGETWKDFTARVYNFGPNYAAVTDQAARDRIDSVAAFIQTTNEPTSGSSGNGPKPGAKIVYR